MRNVLVKYHFVFCKWTKYSMWIFEIIVSDSLLNDALVYCDNFDIYIESYKCLSLMYFNILEDDLLFLKQAINWSEQIVGKIVAAENHATTF